MSNNEHTYLFTYQDYHSGKMKTMLIHGHSIGEVNDFWMNNLPGKALKVLDLNEIEEYYAPEI